MCTIKTNMTTHSAMARLRALRDAGTITTGQRELLERAEGELATRGRMFQSTVVAFRRMSRTLVRFVTLPTPAVDRTEFAGRLSVSGREILRDEDRAGAEAYDRLRREAMRVRPIAPIRKAI